MIDFLEDLRPASCLIVAFTGVGRQLGWIPFEFHRSLSGQPCAALFVRDLGRRWYQYDTGVSNSVKAKIAATASHVGATRLVCLGNSMGGFGAILFGIMCNADAILAISPQSAILPSITDELGDTRYEKYQKEIDHYPHGDLLALAPPRGELIVCHGADGLLDRRHADRLADRTSIRHIVPDCAHDAARQLRDRGELQLLLSRALGS